jgi:hypothetical protein
MKMVQAYDAESLSGIESVSRGELERIFKEKGFFPSSHELLMAREPDFNWARRRRVFATTPHLRWELILSGLIHSLAGTRREKDGLSRPLRSDRILSGDAAAFYFDALISDSLEASRGPDLPEAWETAWETQSIREYESDTLGYPSAGGDISVWAYFPSRFHRFKPGNAIYRLMHAWGALAADLDTTAVVLIRLLKAGSARARIPEILALLEDHMRYEGKHGREALAYDNGVLPEDKGVLLWVGEKHNELDAGVNLNVLCLLAALAERADAEGRARACAIAGPVLEFLARHIGLGSYARPGFLMFYPLASLAFLWYRFALALEGLPAPLRAAFDPNDVCGRLGSHLSGLIESERERQSWNAFDTLLALPMLIRTGSPSWEALSRPESMRSLADSASRRPYEFGRFIYPFTFVYGNRALGPCAALMSCLELRRRAGAEG